MNDLDWNSHAIRDVIFYPDNQQRNADIALSDNRNEESSRNLMVATETTPTSGPHNVEEHDYDEPYVEPATDEEAIIMQLQRLSVPTIPQDSLRYIILLLYVDKLWTCVLRRIVVTSEPGP